MPLYTDSLKVRAIVDVDAATDLTPFIDAAEMLVTEVCVPKVKADGVTPWHSATQLEIISTWLSAHFFCVYDPRGQRERIGMLTFEAQSKVDLGLNVTHYGQMSKILDTSGALAELDKRGLDGKSKFVAKVKWLGKLYDNWSEWSSARR